MKKTDLLALCLVFLIACSENKEKKIPETKTTNETSDSAQDEVIKKWLVGKEWKAENDGAPMSVLKVYSMDSCSFAAPRRYSWDFKNGRFIMLAEWPLTRVNDTTFTLFVEPTQKSFVYNFVKTL